MNQRFGGLAVVVRKDRQRTQRFALESIQRALACLAMQALIGDLGQPLPRLAIHIAQIDELSQRPEVLAKIADRSFDFPFLRAAGRITACGIKLYSRAKPRNLG